MKVYLSLGSNIGDREKNIREALTRLDAACGLERTALSEIIETEALGFDGADFLNCVAGYSCSLSPKELLALCKETERAMGRNDEPEYDAVGRRIYHDRIIDIDILTYGDEHIDTPTLTVPHPQLETRPFIRPLLEKIL